MFRWFAVVGFAALCAGGGAPCNTARAQDVSPSAQPEPQATEQQPASPATPAATEEPAQLGAVPPPNWSPPGPVPWPPQEPRRADTYVPPIADPTRRPPAPELAPPPPTTLQRSTLLLQVMPVVGLPMQGSYEHRLQLRGYSTNEIFTGIDLLGQYRVLPWLWLGGRTGLRYRSFGAIEGAYAGISGQDLMFVTTARGLFGGFLDYWAEASLGVGLAWTSMREVYDFVAAPRVQLGAGAGINFLNNWRVVARISWDWYPLYNVNALGDDAELSGPSFGLGIEWRR